MQIEAAVEPVHNWVILRDHLKTRNYTQPLECAKGNVVGEAGLIPANEFLFAEHHLHSRQTLRQNRHGLFAVGGNFFKCFAEHLLTFGAEKFLVFIIQ